MEDARNLEEDAGGWLDAELDAPASVFSNHSTEPRSCENCVQGRDALRPQLRRCGPTQAPHLKMDVTLQRRRLGRQGPIQDIYPEKDRM